jgi:F0F1-type ATP synthase membrane subunit c/vacuolar-type H+-ATPase subunit K
MAGAGDTPAVPDGTAVSEGLSAAAEQSSPADSIRSTITSKNPIVFI